METNSSARASGDGGHRKIVWAVSDGRAGNAAMALGLAGRAAALIGGTVAHHPLDIGGARAWIAARVPWLAPVLPAGGGAGPALVVGAGRRVAPAVAAMRRTGAKTVQVLDPQMPLSRFDLVVAPQHDGLSAPNTLATLGSVNRVTPALLADAETAWAPRFAAMRRPLVAVLIGGATKRTALDGAAVDRLIADLRMLSGEAGLILTASRRTGEANTARLRDALPEAWIWGGSGENPYFGMLACADAILVTDDSVNMASEAATAGKPLAIYPLLREGGKLARFHEALIARGHAEWFRGAVPAASNGALDETGRAARAVAELVA